MAKKKKKVAKKTPKRKPAKKKVVGKQKVSKKVASKPRKRTDKDYSFENRSKFVDLILEMRNDKKAIFTYRGIANDLSKKGYRNRDAGKITPQFVGNILNRWTENGQSLIG